MKNCIACGSLVEDGTAWAEVTFHGFTSLRLNGIPARVHARCLRMEATPHRDVALPPRNSDPVAEPELVTAERDGYDWHVMCREHGMVALKDTADDAELAVARHLARVHANETWPRAEARRA